MPAGPVSHWHPRSAASLLHTSPASCSYNVALPRHSCSKLHLAHWQTSSQRQRRLKVKAEQSQEQQGRGQSGSSRTYDQSWERRSQYDYPPPPSQPGRPPSGPPPRPPENNNNGGGSDFTKALLAGVFILGIGAGVWFDSQVSFNPSNVASTEILDRKTPNSEVCMASGYSSMVFDQRIFVSFSP